MSENIPKGWKWVKLGEVAEIKMGQSPESKYYNDKGIGLPFLQGNKTFGYRYPEIDMFCSNPIKIARKGEILISVRAPVGDINITNQDICIGRGLASINSLFNQNEFLFYCLKYSKNDLLASETGTVFGSINKDTLNNFPILLPPLPEQKAIAEVLLSLDDKIELLHRQNKTLEEMAMTLFRKWFIEPTKDGLPEGWEIGKFEENLKIVYGKNLLTSKLKDSGYPVFGGNGKIGYYTEYMYEESQVLISCRGEASGKVNISDPKSYITNNSLILERAKNKNISFEYLKYYCLNYDFTQFVTGSAQPQITIEELNNAEILIPPSILINKFSKIISNFETKIFSNKIQIQTLEKLRDTLLPKLMSGEVRVKF